MMEPVLMQFDEKLRNSIRSMIIKKIDNQKHLEYISQLLPSLLKINNQPTLNEFHPLQISVWQMFYMHITLNNNENIELLLATLPLISTFERELQDKMISYVFSKLHSNIFIKTSPHSSNEDTLLKYIHQLEDDDIVDKETESEYISTQNYNESNVEYTSHILINSNKKIHHELASELKRLLQLKIEKRRFIYFLNISIL